MTTDHFTQFVLLGALLEGSRSEQPGNNSLVARQRQDPEIGAVINYWEEEVLPENDKRSRELVLSKPLFEIVDGVLYKVGDDKTMRIFLRTEDLRKMFETARSGMFGGHL